MVTLLLDPMYMSTWSAKMKLAAHLLIRASSLPYTIITTRSIQLTRWKIPNFHAYIFITLVRSFAIQISRCFDIDVLQGSHLGFAGSVFSDRVHYEPLTTLIPLWFSPHDTDMLDTITRFFSAFKNAASELETYYTQLPAQMSTASTNEGTRFPYPTTFTHLRTNINTLLKLEDQPIPGKLLYIGSTEAGQVVVNLFEATPRICMSTVPLQLSHPLSLDLRSSPVTGLWW